MVKTRVRSAIVGLLSTAVFATLSSVGAPLTASATACDSSGPNNYLVGYFRNPTEQNENWEGASAQLTVRPGGLCGGDSSNNNFYCGWVLLSSHNAANYAQVGFIKRPGSSSAFVFVEVNSETGFYAGPNVASGQVDQYWLQYDPTAKREKFNFDNTNLRMSTFDPLTAWTQPIEPQWMDETSYKVNSVPGSTDYPVTWNTILTQRIDNSDFQAMNTNLLTKTLAVPRAGWQAAIVNSNETKAWTP
jgi:hypothetical protein